MLKKFLAAWLCALFCLTCVSSAAIAEDGGGLSEEKLMEAFSYTGGLGPRPDLTAKLMMENPDLFAYTKQKTLFPYNPDYQYHPKHKGAYDHPYYTRPYPSPQHPSIQSFHVDLGNTHQHPYYVMEESRRTEYGSQQGEPGLVLEAPILVSLNRGNGDGNLFLRLSSQYPVSGCFDMGAFQYEKAISDGIYLDIDVRGYPVQPGSCKDGQYAIADIPLTREELEGLTKIRFRVLSRIEYYNISMDDTHVEIRPERYNIIRPRTTAQRYDMLSVNWEG